MGLIEVTCGKELLEAVAEGGAYVGGPAQLEGG